AIQGHSERRGLARTRRVRRYTQRTRWLWRRSLLGSCCDSLGVGVGSRAPSDQRRGVVGVEPLDQQAAHALGWNEHVDGTTIADTTAPNPLDALREGVKVLVDGDATLLEEPLDHGLVEDVREVRYRLLLAVVVGGLGVDRDEAATVALA